MVERAAAGLPRASGDDVDGSFVWRRFDARLRVGTRSFHASVSGVLDHGGRQTRRGPVMPVEQERPFVRVAVPGQNEIYAGPLEDGQRVLDRKSTRLNSSH